MKVYIITIEDVFDGSSNHTAPIVKKTIEEARKELDELYVNQVKLYGDSFDCFEKSENCFEMCEEGYCCQNHYSAVIDEVEIPD